MQENLSYDNDDYYYYEDENDEEYFRRKQRELRAERLRRMQERRRAWVRKIYSKQIGIGIGLIACSCLSSYFWILNSKF